MLKFSTSETSFSPFLIRFNYKARIHQRIKGRVFNKLLTRRFFLDKEKSMWSLVCRKHFSLGCFVEIHIFWYKLLENGTHPQRVILLPRYFYCRREPLNPTLLKSSTILKLHSKIAENISTSDPPPHRKPEKILHPHMIVL